MFLKSLYKIHYTCISTCFSKNYFRMFTNTTHTLLSDDKLKVFVITDFSESQRNDFTATSFTDLHFNTKLRIPSGTSPIRVYDIALI